AIIAGTLLPYLAARDRRLLKPTSEKLRDGEIEIENEDEEDEEHVEMERIREMVQQWKAEAAREGRPLKLPTSKVLATPRQLVKRVLMYRPVGESSAVHVEKHLDGGVGPLWVLDDVNILHHQGLASDSDDRSGRHLLGYCLLGTVCFLKELDDKPPPRTSDGRPRPTHARTTSTPLGWRSHPSSPMGRASPVERTPLTRSYSTADLEGANEMEYTGQGPVAGGTIMGIHNLAIVFPQFIARLILILFPCGIAVVASIIFKLADSQPDIQPTSASTSVEGGGPHGQDKNGVAWVLRFGGLMAFVGALVSRKVPPTKTEKAMRRRLADMREESAE
ncbi:solute carrier family 45, member 1/2/4, partial [Cryptococcus neoformans MW-RSA852]